MNKKKILFVLSGNLSTTPRAVKNIELAMKNGYHVDVIKLNRASTWNHLDEAISRKLQINPVSVSPGRENILFWLKIQFLYKLATIASGIFKNSTGLMAFSSQKTYIQIWHVLRKFKQEYRLIIGQGSGTTYPVFLFARKKRIPYSLDIEDYYPGETTDTSEKNKIDQLLRIILPKASYVSYGSPLIRSKTLSLLETGSITKSNHVEQLNDTIYLNSAPHILLNNSFPDKEFIPPAKTANNSLKLVWFSQNISFNRGLEHIIPAVKKFKNEIELHLIGNLYPSFGKEWIEPNKDFITVLPPLLQEELHKLISHYDVGLALEPGKDLNNNLAESNKIYAYAQAGLYILATSTAGQENFLKSHQWAGMLCNPSSEAMYDALKNIKINLIRIREEKIYRYNNAKSLAWENESKKLLHVWEENKKVGSSKLEAGRGKLEGREAGS